MRPSIVAATVFVLGLPVFGLAEERDRPSPGQTEPAPATAPASAPPRDASRAPASRPITTPSAEDLSQLEEALAQDQQQRQEAKVDSDKPATTSGHPSGPASALQSLNPQLAFIADVAAAYFSIDDPPVVGGHDPSETGFHLQQLELYATAAVDPYFRFDASLVFHEAGVEIEEVFATTLALPWNLQARAGQFLTRFGRFNATHPHTWRFVDQPLVHGKFFGGEGNRGLGVELSALLPVPWYVEVLTSVTDAAGGGTARSFFGGEDLGVDGVEDFQYTAAIKQFFPLSDDWSLMWGVSTALGPNATGRDNRTDIYGTDLYIKYRPISRGSYTIVALQAEWLLRRRQVPLDVLQDQGVYAQLFYRFARRWAVAGRHEAVSGAEGDPLDPRWDGLRQRASGNLTFWPTEFSRLRLQYSHDRPGWRKPYHALYLALEFSAGAHGAHRF
jgi:hypothetical protein